MPALPASAAEGLVTAAGLARDTPLSLAWIAGGERRDLVRGVWPDGAAVAVNDLFYAASLTKQLTGAAVALLVKDGRIDPDAPVPAHFLPRWPTLPTPRQLLHHLGGLPAETMPGHGDWTNAYALEALGRLASPDAPPGSAFAYSNLGYIVLARLVEAASGSTFAKFVADRLLRPLGITAARICDERALLPASPHLARLGPILPLSTGDGGLWTTAAAFATWLDAQNRDRFGIAHLVQADALLPGGEPVRYGWGIGQRSLREYPLYIHGGGWPGARSKAVRCPALGLSVVALAADNREEPVGLLVDAMLNRLADDVSRGRRNQGTDA